MCARYVNTPHLLFNLIMYFRVCEFHRLFLSSAFRIGPVAKSICEVPSVQTQMHFSLQYIKFYELLELLKHNINRKTSVFFDVSLNISYSRAFLDLPILSMVIFGESFFRLPVFVFWFFSLRWLKRTMSNYLSSPPTKIFMLVDYLLVPFTIYIFDCSRLAPVDSSIANYFFY